MTKLSTIPIDQLVLGMYVVHAGEGTFDSPVTKVGSVMRKNLQIQVLRQTGARSVVIDSDRSEGSAAQDQKRFTSDLAAVDSKLNQAVNYSRSMMQDVRLGHAVNCKEAAGVVETMLDTVFKNESAALFLTKLGDYDDYTYMHCVNVSVLASIFAKHLGFNDEEILEIGLSGLIHDLGKALIPDSILNKPGKLSEEEFAVMRSHPLKGYELIRGVQGLTKNTLLGLLEHHEKWDGRGYPGGLKGERISTYARVLAVVDIYDAMTSNRVYHKGRAETDVLAYLFSHKGDFAPTYVERFVKAVGIYPPGTLIRLSNGTLAMVCETNPGDALRPTISPVTQDLIISPVCISFDSLDESGDRIKVVEVLDRQSHVVDISPLRQ